MVEHLSVHCIGFSYPTCLGNVFWDANAKHISVLPDVTLNVRQHLLTDALAPWLHQCAGETRPKQTAKTKRSVTSEPEDEPLPGGPVAENSIVTDAEQLRLNQALYDRRVAIPVNPHRCKARTFELWQCSKPPLLVTDFCKQHSTHGAKRHGRVEDPVPQWLREAF